MLSCKKLVENASEYVDGDLSGWQRFNVKMHLFMCVHCKRYMHQLTQTIGFLGKLPRQQPSEELEKHVCDEYKKAMQDKQN
ncbi:MAG: zf-HC2 domain-containing protein [Kangiellaceae bacterium]|nr:zf-HC2 domain-containing protein [Kangiellaceae bacterium]